MLLLLVVSSACGGPGLILKGPISDQCRAAGLSGCPELAEGAIAYIEGEKETGTAALRKGLQANLKVPDKLKQFAQNLKPVLDLPGVSSYADPLKMIISMIEETAAEPGPSKTAKHKRGDSDDAVVQSDAARSDDTEDAAPDKARRRETGRASDDGEIGQRNLGPRSPLPEARPRTRDVRAATVLVSSDDSLALPCTPLSSMSPTFSGESSLCRPVATGPVTIVGVYVASECPNRIIISSGDPKSPRWYLMSTPSQALSLSGLELPVAEGQSVNVALVARDRKKLRPDVRCAVTLTAASLLPDTPSAPGSNPASPAVRP